MTIIQLKCFVAAAKRLNFAKAAQDLYITQPAVSQHIHSLEEELGVKLFIRTGKNIVLSSAGELFLPDTADILNRLEQSTRRLAKLEESELLNVGYSYQLVYPGLKDILRQYHEKMPNVQLNLHYSTINTVQKQLSDKLIDVVFAPRNYMPMIADWQFKRIRRCEMFCIVSKDHRFSTKSSVSFEDLKGEHLIMLNDSSSPPAMSKVLRSIRELTPDIIIHYSDSAALTVPMVAAGIGIAIMPDYVITDKSSITAVPFEMSENIKFDIEYGLFYPEGELPAKIKELVNLF